MAICVEIAVDKFPRISPQGQLIPLAGFGTTSGWTAPRSIHIYGSEPFIHIIHMPYYYYDSYIPVHNKLEFIPYILYNDLNYTL